MTDATAPAAATPAPARTRAPRRSPTDLTFRLDDALVERFAGGEPDWLAADRRGALTRFRALPIESNRLYTPYIDLRAADLEAVRAYEAPAGEASGRVALPVGTAGLAALREDAVEALELDEHARAAGVTLETLNGLVRRDPATARQLLGDEASLPADDALAQLTRAGWNQGIAVRVPAGVKLDRPIVLRWTAGAPGHALLTRTIVELGDGASASLVEELLGSTSPSAGDVQALFTGSLEVRLGRGAELAVASIQDFGPRQVAFQHRDAVMGEGASLHWALAQLGSQLVRSRVDNRLIGDRSTVEQVEIVFGADDQLFDLTSYTRHVGRDTTGNLLSKGALLDRSRSYMKGLIVIERTAIGTDSFLGEFGMNLSRGTRAVAIPSLEIDQPDCRRAAHSSSVGPIDEAQLFYLESRGIPPDEARKFIVLGFLEPVVARVPLIEAQDRLRELLEAKWAAGSAAGASATAA
ncbi:MAG: SufD family Fe-S cluster assembly protein [Chloroflexota bacterium]|nr:SufD family Fe-S cluster assembly protein [Chloroflexota bacterium]